ncbi:hypothetical protein ml_167 [Mollivirus sibericum]|uniref:hypothetical protein n=1 Tax=Mollivirus sibericum TaxID=1678078 RepID=UPI0006B2D9DB|nr:hypothetical protein ml_167 [Mollivirus sibericum]ALD61969.1 hypothetical protein ml_167 [Mollivirus sibericum]
MGLHLRDPPNTHSPGERPNNPAGCIALTRPAARAPRSRVSTPSRSTRNGDS